ncbi:putative respiratory burst oxidase homolog protein H isoform X2 [Cucumis sativus]|uniref:putative respiratory burst oxidase homolog protein H isoform X2 n=1 Tax=Cucumis sativus TaxID=3659 RepID=UPI0012F51F19|nr:putative respiratory burst oxidase homolog protein H isoform X2 [Cucumis sativus]
MANENSTQQPSSPFDPNKNNLLSFLDFSVVKSWDDVKTKFHQQMVNGKLFKKNFGVCIGFDERSKHFAYELFDVLSKRKKIKPDDGITLQQLKEFWDELKRDDQETRLAIFFDLCDLNDDDKISKEEIETILKWTASANNLKSIENQIENYASLIIKEFDPDGNGSIEKKHLKLLVKELSKSKEANVLKGEVDDEVSLWPDVCTLVRETLEVIKQNRKQIWFSTLWLAINVSLFIWKFNEYKEKKPFDYELINYCTGIAKGAAETLKFNMGLILFLACRRSLTTLKSTFLSSIFPFDDHIFFHMMVGLAISIATFIHMAMHLGCGFPLLSTLSLSYKLKGIIEPSFDHSKKPSNFDLISVPGVTGILMFSIMSCAFILGIHCLRKSSRGTRESCYHIIGFNAFWYAHRLLFLVYPLLILHGYFDSLASDWLNRTTWKYVAIPMLVYTSEGIYTIIKKQIYEVKVLKATVYSKNDLVALRLEKPKRFKYESGSYVYVNCEDIAACEWHPFSITSAPDDEYLSLHIRNAGDWTEKLVERFGKAVEGGKITKIGGIHRQENINDSKWESGEKYPKILIKGPYGAVTQDYKKYKVLLLIGFGTGATPMISILKDILNQIKTHEKEKSTDENGESKFKKAYFYWITRTEESFEWFKGVMNDVAEHDNGRVIEMNNHLSSIKREGDPRSVFVTILQNIQTKIEEIDFISRSRIRARHGKPDWETVFLKLKKEHSGVFFCGDSSFNEVAIKCRKHSDDSTQFEYHHEGT